ncbi:hypothetical protein AB0J48_20500 [Nocardia salmonicida]|uniref:hypothetical protein n=1 Tax=Nocardia salmonicida TaxID=53431 RepID=UPI00341CCC6B
MILGLDLDDWLRGERDWVTLWEFAERIRARPGTAYGSAILQDPEVVEALAAEEESDGDLPIEGFGFLESRLATIEDRVTQLLWVSSKSDPAGAPRAARPVYPHIELREGMRRARMTNLEHQLIPEGGD